MESVPIEHLAEFLAVASRLILLKSRALLPVLSFSPEQESDVCDLEWRLEEYKRYREAAERIGTIFRSGSQCFSREPFLGMPKSFSVPKEVNGRMVQEAFDRVLKSIPVPVSLPEKTLPETITIEECIARLEARVARSLEGAFSEIVSGAAEKIEIIVSFLALLELVRRKTFHIEQEGMFGEIRFRFAPAVS